MARVLVVDDEAPVRTLLGQAIRRAGHQVIEAESSDAALNAMEKRPAGVVFVDIRLPGRDGRWLTLELRKRYPATAVVIATSVTNLEPAITLRFGVLSYLVKPFDLASVNQALDRAVDWHAEATASGVHDLEQDQLEVWLKSLDIL